MLSTAPSLGVAPELAATIGRLARLRRDSVALRRGTYRQLFVKHEQFGFLRQAADETVAIIVNSASEPTEVELPLPMADRPAVDLLDSGEPIRWDGGTATVTVPACGARILRV